VLDTVTHSRRELKRLAYLEIPAPKWPAHRAARAVRAESPVLAGARLPGELSAHDDGASARMPQAPVAVS
jgi:hypothetical protein